MTDIHSKNSPGERNADGNRYDLSVLWLLALPEGNSRSPFFPLDVTETDGAGVLPETTDL